MDTARWNIRMGAEIGQRELVAAKEDGETVQHLETVPLSLLCSASCWSVDTQEIFIE